MKENGKLNACVVCNLKNANDYNQLLCGWSSGKVQIRHENTGEILLEYDFHKEVSKLFIDNLNKNDTSELIICLNNGSVHGLIYLEEELFEKQNVVTDITVRKEDVQKYERLLHEKNELIKQLEEIEVKISNKSKINLQRDENYLPVDTKVSINLQANNEKVTTLILNCKEMRRFND